MQTVSKTDYEPSLKLILTHFAGAALLTGAAFIFNPTDTKKVLKEETVSADSCSIEAAQQVSEKFAAASIGQQQAEWSLASFNCVEKYGLPQQVDIAFDTTSSGSNRFARKLSPEGF